MIHGVKYTEWTAPIKHMHGNWPGKIPHVLDGHMTIQNLDQRMTLFHKMFL
jgi:hypothetical protein